MILIVQHFLLSWSNIHQKDSVRSYLVRRTPLLEASSVIESATVCFRFFTAESATACKSLPGTDAPLAIDMVINCRARSNMLKLMHVGSCPAIDQHVNGKWCIC